MSNLEFVKKFGLLIVLILCFSTKSYDCAVSNRCDQDQNIFMCEGHKFLNKNVDRVLKQMKNLKSVQIVPGLNLEYDNALNEVETQELLDKDSLLLKFLLFLKTHHLKVNFSHLLNRQNSKEIEEILNEEGEGSVQSEARKKDKGGGYLLMSALMMGKMLAALAFGGISALALKALGVSMMALLLSSILGLKKLTDGGHDHGYSGHHIEYVAADHHRRRRGTFKNINMI